MSTDHTPDRTFRELSPLPADNLQDSAALLFAEVEIVGRVEEDALFCSACGFALSEERIDRGDDLCRGCEKDANYER